MNWSLTHTIPAEAIRLTQDRWTAQAARKGNAGPTDAVVSRIKVATICNAIPLPNRSFRVEPWTTLPDGSVAIDIHFETEIERDIAEEAIQGRSTIR